MAVVASLHAREKNLPQPWQATYTVGLTEVYRYLKCRNP